MLNYDCNSIFQTSFWEKLEERNKFTNDFSEAFYGRKEDTDSDSSWKNVAGQVRETTKRTYFMRFIDPARMKDYPDSAFPFEATINYIQPTSKEQVEFILIYSDRDNCVLEIATSKMKHPEGVIKNTSRAVYGKADRKKIKTKAQQAYDTMRNATQKLERAGFVVVKTDVED